MQDLPEPKTLEQPQRRGISPWRFIGWLCATVIVGSVVACVLMAVMRSHGLTKITVTALDATAEPRDHALPFVKQKEALPDYELILVLTNGFDVYLGAKPDSSAADGLTWHINEPVSVADIASVRLQEQDKIISDAIAEVQVHDSSITEKGYRFEFVTERSISVGILSFFGTPIGQAILVGFAFAVILMLMGLYYRAC